MDRENIYRVRNKSDSDVSMGARFKKDIMIPMYERQLKDFVLWSNRWKKIGNCCHITATILSGFAVIWSFIAGFYDIREFIFIAGVTSALVMAVSQYSTKAFAEANKKLEDIDMFFKKLNIEMVGFEDGPPIAFGNADDVKIPTLSRQPSRLHSRHRTPTSSAESSPTKTTLSSSTPVTPLKDFTSDDLSSKYKNIRQYKSATKASVHRSSMSRGPKTHRVVGNHNKTFSSPENDIKKRDIKKNLIDDMFATEEIYEYVTRDDLKKFLMTYSPEYKTQSMFVPKTKEKKYPDLNSIGNDSIDPDSDDSHSRLDDVGVGTINLTNLENRIGPRDLPIPDVQEGEY